MVSDTRTGNVKVRDDMVDAKRLLDIYQGLERWTPIRKADFPISPDVLRDAVFPLLELDPPPLHDDPYGEDEFYGLFAGRAAVVPVGKDRRLYRFGGCRTEVTDVVIEGIRYQTAAVESVDTKAVLTVAERLGIADLPNENYIEAIRRLVTWV